MYCPTPLTASKSLMKVSLSYSYLTTGFTGLLLVSHDTGSNHMIVDFEYSLIWILLASFLGAGLLISFRYYSLYERACKAKLKRGEDPEDWDNRAFVAAAVDIILGVVLTYGSYRVANWLYTGQPFGEEDIPAVLLIAAIFGAGAAYVVDAWFPQAWLNGQLDKAYIQGQALIREAAKSEEARQKAIDMLEAKAKALGVVDEEKIRIFCKIASAGGKLDLMSLQKIAEIVNGNDADKLTVFLGDDNSE